MLTNRDLLAAAFACAFAGVADAQQAQQLTGNPPSWVNLGSGNDYDNNDGTPGNGPKVGIGTGSDGDYMTWTWDGKQMRVLKSSMTTEQWAVWSNLDGKKIEFTMDDGVVTDVHEDV